MTQEIEEIIKKNLPAQVGEVLQARLKLATDLENTNKALANKIDNLEIKQKEMHKEIERYKELDARNSSLDAREKAISDRERNAEITELKFKVAEAEKRADMVKEFTMGLVRNTQFRKTVFDSENQMGYTNDRGQWIQPSPVNKSLDETKTAQ